MSTDETINDTPEEEVIGPRVEIRRKAEFFELQEDANGDWHWVLWAKNGRPLATNLDGYSRQIDAISAIKTIIAQDERTQILIAHQ